MNKRQVNAQITRAKLIDSVKELLKTKPFDEINVVSITQHAGVAKGTFYIYFKRKEDILYEIGFKQFDGLYDRFVNSKKDFMSNLEDYASTFIMGFEQYGINVCRGWISDVLNPNSGKTGVKENKFLNDLEVLKRILAYSVEKGYLKKETPVETLANIIVVELYGIATTWCMSDGKFVPSKWNRKFCKFQLKKIFSSYIKKENV